jgi:hypothetical protein
MIGEEHIAKPIIAKFIVNARQIRSRIVRLTLVRLTLYSYLVYLKAGDSFTTKEKGRGRGYLPRPGFGG